MIAAVAAPAQAQDASASSTVVTQPRDTGAPPASGTPSTALPAANGAPADGSASTVTVTGSRLRNSEFTSGNPVQVVDAARANLEGFTDVSQLLQSTTVAGNGTQINNNFSGFVINGGPGVNTVGLRGTAPDRTLVLLDGKRLGPAGTQGAVGAVDLNTLPTALIDHIDILKDGSSSIYGSDAVEGVVNIITKKNFNGGDFRATTTPTIGGGGNQTDISGSYGKTFQRGYITLSGDFYRQDILRLRDRNYLNCEQDEASDPTTGMKEDLIDPVTGGTKCQNQLGGLAIDYDTGRRYIVTPDTTATNISPAGLTQVHCVILNSGACARAATSNINVPATRNSFALQPTNNSPYFLEGSAVSPVRRWTTTFSGAYDILPDYIQVYNDFLYNKRQSNQVGTQQLFPYLPYDNPSNPLAPLGDDAEPIVSNPLSGQQNVDYYHDVLGVRGALPDFFFLKNWRYDVSGVYSRSDGSYTSDYVRLDRINAVTGDLACDTSGTNQGGSSMDQLEPGVACQPVNWTRATQANALSTSEKNFLMGEDTGHTVYDQTYVEGDFNGDLFRLPAGTVSADLGFHLRRDHIKDVPGPATQAQNLYNLAGEGVTAGTETVEEGYGEIGIPVLKDLPLIHNLSLDASGRYSHYSTAGDARTYKASVRWDLTDWIGVKFDQGTSFRAPALFEIYQSESQGFLSQTSIDPCINYQQQNATIAAHCAAQGIPADYAGNTPSAEVTSSGGGANLKPETAFAKTVGLVFRPKLPFAGYTLGAEVDYYQNTISDTITQFGANNIITECYNQSTFPNGYCNLFTRNLDENSQNFGQITNVTNNYLNVGKFVDRGIDLTIHATAKLPYDVRFYFDSYHSWTLQETTELLPGTITDYNGTVGTPRYVGNFNFTFKKDVWTLNWFTSIVSPSNDDKLAANRATADVVNNYSGTDLSENILIKYPFYSVSNLAIERDIPRWNAKVLIGLNNVFDISPPAYSRLGYESVVGVTALTSQYDYIGRAVRLQFDKKF